MSIFLYHPDIAGEVADAHHLDWIDVDDICFGTRRRITARASIRHDRESANAELKALTLCHRADSATPYLFLASCCGRGRTVVVDLTETGTGSGSDTFVSYTLKNSLVSSYEVDAHAADDARPTELLTIAYTAMEVRYLPYDEDGRPLPPISVSFDATTNEKG